MFFIGKMSLQHKITVGKENTNMNQEKKYKEKKLIINVIILLFHLHCL